MQRNEKIVLIREVPSAIIEALDGVMDAQGLMRLATREIAEDFTPLLADPDGPVAVVLSLPNNDWTACWTSLAPDDEWMLAEAIAVGLSQPTVYAVLSDDTTTYAYRYFEDAILHEEFLPDDLSARFDAETLLARLAARDIPLELLDDRTQNFGAEHILIGYGREQDVLAATAMDEVDEQFEPIEE